jgi:cardiolipin synthase
MPDVGFMNGLARAVARGVDVRVLVPVASDSAVADLASRATFARLLKAGIRLVERSPMVHGKALLVDRDFVSIGSYNFDHCLDRDCNQALAAMFEDDMATGKEIHLEDLQRRSWFTRLLERLAYGLRRWL